MKKFLLSSLVVTSVLAFAYTQTDVDNATYLASKGIITAQSTTAGYRLDDTITRAEVAGIALKLRGTTLPEGYTCKKYFSDTIKNDWICRAVELAADAGLVSRSNNKFRPGEKITRAEAFAIIYKSSGLSGSAENYHFSTNEGEQWQKDLFYKIYNLGLSLPGTTKTEIGAGVQYYWTPNRNATRAEIFGFAKNILEYKATMSGEVNLYLQNLIDAKKKNINTVDTDSRLDESTKK